jgi:hypothetical protein
MSATELVASILLHLIPVFAILFFYPFIRKPLWRKLYIRLSLCFMAFWFGYYVLPVLLFGFGLNLQPTEFNLSGVYNPWLSAIGYYITIFVNLVAIFVRETLLVMPFAFIFAPLISVVILILYLRGEKGSFKEKINELTYRYESSPLQKVRDRLAGKSWKEEKEMFKLMIVFLPISLYVLTLILTIFNQGAATAGIINTAIGVFIEDLVAYVASFLAAVYLLYSSKLSFRGRSVGDRIRFSVDRFLLTTGTILAAFSIIAFVISFSQSLITLAYFVIHYVMMSVIFAILLPLFEPFGSLVLIKTINSLRRFSLKVKSTSIFNRRTLTALVLGFTIASAALLLQFVIELVTPLLGPIQNYYDIPKITGGTLLLTFSDELLFIRLFMIFSLQDVFQIIVLSVILAWFTRQQNAPILGTVMSTAIFSTMYFALTNLGLAVSLIPTGQTYYWVTAVPALMTATDFTLPASRLGTLNVYGTLLTGGATLFMSLSPMLLLLFLTYLIRYWRHPFTLTRKVGDKDMTEKAYSSLGLMPSLAELKQSPEAFEFKYLGGKKLGAPIENMDPDTRRDIENVAGKLGGNGLVSLSQLADETKFKEKRIYEILRYLVSTRMVEVYGLEFASVTHRPTMQSLYVTTREGLSVFNYSFGSLSIDPALVSGMLTAITSFIKEATKSKQYLRTIEHGDVILIVEFGKLVFATIVADQETPDLRMKLRLFLDGFEIKHAALLSHWTGAVPDLTKDNTFVESIFGKY